jgi:hypothetical protein
MFETVLNVIEQYKSAGINPWNNNWGNIHDFTTIPDGKNYSLLDKVVFYVTENIIFYLNSNRMKMCLNICQFQRIHHVIISM